MASCIAIAPALAVSVLVVSAGARADMTAAGQIDPAIGFKFTAARISVP